VIQRAGSLCLGFIAFLTATADASGYGPVFRCGDPDAREHRTAARLAGVEVVPALRSIYVGPTSLLV
jgi:hypothetical protein